MNEKVTKSHKIDCQDLLAPLRAAFQRLDGWCPDGLLTAAHRRSCCHRFLRCKSCNINFPNWVGPKESSKKIQNRWFLIIFNDCQSIFNRFSLDFRWFRSGEVVPDDLGRLMLEADPDGVGVLDFTTFVAIAVGAQELVKSPLAQRSFNFLDRDQELQTPLKSH